jgi:hypothetical protein
LPRDGALGNDHGVGFLMALEIKIEAKGLTPKTSKSQIRTLKTVALKIIAKSWHDRYAAKKFTPAAAAKYNYAKRLSKEVRTGRITKIGRRMGKKGPISGAPLVWTGDTRSRVTNAKNHITGNSKRSYAKYSARKLNFRPRGINMRAEFTRVLKAEQKVIGRDGEKWIRQQFSKGKKNISVNVT